MAEGRAYSLSGRLALVTAAWSVCALLVMGLVLVELFRNHLEQGFDRRIAKDLTDLVRGAVAARQRGQEAALYRLDNPVYAEPFSGWAWQVRDGEAITAQSRSLGPLLAGVAEPLPVPAAEGGIADFTAPGGFVSRGLSRSVSLAAGEAPLAFTVAGPRSEIDGNLTYFSRLLAYSLAIFAGLMFGASLLLSRILLQPVARLKEAVSQLRDGRQEALDQRWPSEFAPVAEELGGLNAHISRLLERSRDETADLAHALKTPLSIIRQAAEAPGPDSSKLIIDQVDKIAGTADWHLTHRRVAGPRHGRISLREVAEDVAFALSRLFAGRGIDIAVEVDPGAHFLGDAEDLQEILGNLAENACKWARSSVTIRGEMAEGRLKITILDDGDGFPDPGDTEVFRRGVRLDETAPGHGHGLAIVGGIVKLYDGEITICEPSGGGGCVCLMLPGTEKQAGG